MELLVSNNHSVECLKSIKIHYVKDFPKNPRAVLIVVHGFGEHLGRYDYLKDKLLSYGYGVYRFDIRGHGKSGGERGHIKSFEDYTFDANEIVNVARRENPNLPVFMLGHSMGGLITALYGTIFEGRINGQILSSAATLEPIQSKGTKGKILKYANMITPKWPVKNPVARDETELKAVTLNLYVQFLVYGIRQMRENMKEYSYPCLILHGEDDRLIKKEASLNMYSNIASTDKRIKIYKGLRHELLKKNRDDLVFEDIHRWIEERIS